jgi:hypothetical protein
MITLKKIGLFLCVCATLIGSVTVPSRESGVVHAAGPEKLLSGNTLGSLFPVSTQTIATGATYSWLTDGTHATDAAIISTDNNGAPDMSDGINGPDGNYSNNSTWDDHTVAFGNLIYDLKDVYKVSSVKIWADTATNSSMKKFEVLASIDGLTYNSAGIAGNTNAANSGFAPVMLSVKPVIYARYIKVIMHKDTPQFNMRLGEVAVFGDDLEPQALLSNNFLRENGPYNSTDTPKLPTNATYTWVEEHPFVTQSGLKTTDNDSLDDGAGGIADLIDGSSMETTPDLTVSSDLASQGKFGAVIFDLNDMYQVGTIDVWTQADSGAYMDGYEALVSTDGLNYTSLGYTANVNSRTSNSMVNTITTGLPGRNAKYVKIVMHNANDSQQLTVGEIAIWGWKLYDTTLSETSIPEQVELKAELKNYSIAYLDWSSYNHVANNVNKYAVYVETSDYTTVAGLTAKTTLDPGWKGQKGKFAPYFSLKPETTYYIAVTPFRANVERKEVSTIKLTTPSVLGGDKVGDIFAVNDPPYGEGAHYVKHDNNPNDEIDYEALNRDKKLVLLREIGGINKSRWSSHQTDTLKEYAKNGISFHSYYHGVSNIPSDNNHGVWTFSTYNEPDDTHRYKPPAEVAAAITNNHAAVKGVDSRNLLVEPATWAVDATSLEYIRQMYDSDGQNGAVVKTKFDVMDVHPYVKHDDEPVTGLDRGAPEKLISKISDLKALMASRDDADKPIIFTEVGWSTYTAGFDFMKMVDRPTQRNYLARAYMHAIAGGIKSVFWFNFQDGGTTNIMEHNFGIVDWNAVPKDSYYGYYTMVRVLRDTKYLGTVSGISNPYYGYRFWNEHKNQYITSLWDASWQTTSTTNKTATITTADTGITVVGIDGSHQYLAATAGVVNVPITGAPIFIYSNKSVTVASVN